MADANQAANMFDLFKSEFAPTKWRKSSDVQSDELRIRVLDEAGCPVEGTVVGDNLTGYGIEDNIEPELVRFKGIPINLPSGSTSVLRFIRPFPLPRSGPDGIINIPSKALSIADPSWQTNRPSLFYVIHPERRIGGLACCRARDLGKETKLILKPLCHVHGEIIRADGQALPGVKTFAFWGPIHPWRLIPTEQGSRKCEVDILLPPGQYRLQSLLTIQEDEGTFKSLEDWKKIEITDNQVDLKVDMKLTFSKYPPKSLPCCNPAELKKTEK